MENVVSQTRHSYIENYFLQPLGFLKGHCHEISTLVFFHQTIPPMALLNVVRDPEEMNSNSLYKKPARSSLACPKSTHVNAISQ
jgi:hypothetical protein